MVFGVKLQEHLLHLGLSDCLQGETLLLGREKEEEALGLVVLEGVGDEEMFDGKEALLSQI
jgi:hypothetical protein